MEQEHTVTLHKSHRLSIEGHELFVELDLEYAVTRDPAYGADADGMRGTERWTAACTGLTVRDAGNRDITLNLMTRRPKQFERLLEYADSLLDCAIDGAREE